MEFIPPLKRMGFLLPFYKNTVTSNNPKYLSVNGSYLFIVSTYSNPYYDDIGDKLESFNHLSAPMDEYRNLKEKREDYVRKYSWAIPSSEALSEIEKLEPIVEIGAGNGYWAWLLQQNNTEIKPFDIYARNSSWTTVYPGAEIELQDIEDDFNSLLLCWPPHDEPMAADATKLWGGEYIIYIGEKRGCTGDDEFYSQLSDWELIKNINIPSWPGIRDQVYIYRNPYNQKQPLSYENTPLEMRHPSLTHDEQFSYDSNEVQRMKNRLVIDENAYLDLKSGAVIGEWFGTIKNNRNTIEYIDYEKSGNEIVKNKIAVINKNMLLNLRN